MNKLQMAEQFRKAVQLYSQTLDPDSALIIATVFDPWAVGKAYKINEYLIYGENEVGDPQLYQVLMGHTSQADWTPDITPSLYKAVGIDPSGYPVWVQPVGAADAYMQGDIVWCDGQLWISAVDYNVWKPGAVGSENLWNEYTG